MLAIALGTEDFKEVIQKNSYYVDKTSFIKELVLENVALFTRPRRFGKTLTMSMLNNFFEINYDNPSDITRPQKLFKNQAISKDIEFCQHHMGQYPVIALTFKDVSGETFAGAMSALCSKYLQLWRRYENVILNSPKLSASTKRQIVGYTEIFLNITLGKVVLNNETDLEPLKNFVSLLSEILFRVFDKKTIIIVDEYDVPLEKSRGKYYRDMVDFISKLFSVTFKTNDCLEKGFLTGCLRVSRESIFTGFNNLQVYDCSEDEYAELFGFTSDEVKQLLKDYKLSDRYEIFKEWYDGYQFGEDTEIYNPYSVLTYVHKLTKNPKKKPVNAWINVSSNSFLTEFINYLPNSELSDFKNLLDGGTVEKKLNMTLNYGDLENHDDIESLWTMLYVTGYLTKVSEVEDDIYTLKIPNKEVRKCFQENIVKYFTKSPEHYNNIQKLTNAFINNQVSTITTLLNKVLPKYLSLRDVKANQEYTYHSFMDGFLANSGLDVSSQKEAGDGYPDISFTMKNPETGELVGVILELKRATSDDEKILKDKCREALKQCNDKTYYSDYQERPDVNRIYMYGIAFCNRKCAVVAEEVLKM